MSSGGAQDVVVALSDRREFKAKVSLADKRTDLAVLKIDTKGKKLPTVAFGNSDKLQVGDLVLAIGDPFGVGQTTTMGIVSALARIQGHRRQLPLLHPDRCGHQSGQFRRRADHDRRQAGRDQHGDLFAHRRQSIGIGFAIPANLAQRVVDGALGGGVKLPWFGAEGQTVTADIAGSLGMSAPQGVLLKSVYPGGPAAKAGLKTGDVVMAMDGIRIDSMDGLNYRTATHKPGDGPTVKVFSNGHEHDVTVKLALPPETPPRDTTTIGGRNPLTGAKVENLSPAVATDLQMDLMAKGVVVISPGNSYAARQGFQSGDIVKSVNGQPIKSVRQLKQALDAAAQQGGWNLVVDRDGQAMTLSVRD